MINDLSPAWRRSRRRPLLQYPRLLIVGVATTVAAFVLLAGDVYGGSTVAQPLTVRVQAGDTLWSVAAARYPTADPRERVAQIIDLNHLDGAAITPGETLSLPAP